MISLFSRVLFLLEPLLSRGQRLEAGIACAPASNLCFLLLISYLHDPLHDAGAILQTHIARYIEHHRIARFQRIDDALKVSKCRDGNAIDAGDDLTADDANRLGQIARDAGWIDILDEQTFHAAEMLLFDELRR